MKDSTVPLNGTLTFYNVNQKAEKGGLYEEKRHSGCIKCLFL